MRKSIVVAATLMMVFSVALVGTAGAQRQRFPSVIELPEGYSPEGIARGRGTTLFVGSLADGTIWKGDARTGQGAVFTESTGPFSTVGLDHDHRNRVWVAGGPTGVGRVYNGTTGELLATYNLTAPGESFINDVIVTRRAAYFTDSGSASSAVFPGSPRLFRVPLGRSGRLSASGAAAVEIVPVDVPDIGFPNLNGIETAPARGGLIVAHSSFGSLFTVDPETGAADELNLPRKFEGADGVARRGRSMFVVENAASRITHVRINPRRDHARIVDVLSVDGAETPTTVAIFGPAVYAVDARFSSMTGPYNIFRVPV